MFAPPSWITAAGTRLDLAQFGAEFARGIDGVASSFRKVEAWQEYQEPGTTSIDAFRRGEFELAEELIRAEADHEIDAYRELQRKDLALTRLRLVRRPLTEYLRWEMVNYRIRTEPRYGERVKIVDCTDVRSPLELPEFDFLLFDGSVALVHDYGKNGLQTGGWKVTADAETTFLSGLTESWGRNAVDLKETTYGSEYSGTLVETRTR